MKNNFKIIFGTFLVVLSILITVSIFSFMYNWQEDQSLINGLFNSDDKINNIGKKIGFYLSYYLVYKSFGIGSLLICLNILIVGLSLSFNKGVNNILNRSFILLFSCIWVSIFCGYFISNKIYAGVFGFEVKNLIINFSGEIGLILLLLFGIIVFMITVLNLTPIKLFNFLGSIIKMLKEKIKRNNSTGIETIDDNQKTINEENSFVFKNDVDNDEIKPTIENFSKFDLEKNKDDIINSNDNIEMKIETISDEERINSESENILKKYGEFDPTLELKGYKQPQIKLLSEHNNDGVITINQEELEENKEKIIDTLKNYKIGIEVPNKSRKIVSMKSLISSKKFQDAEMELPLALGKTISNETFVVDFSRMPHLLMAGATGQGKSVGINAIITSLLYKKHPSEIKFILVDPKKVELTLFNKIERHYLAKLPASEEPIITDNKVVIKTLNSLCIEMEQRYDLLKNGLCRNIKEYNIKFKKRKLNPNDGHKFLPYLVLVIDEFADLIMTTGKEVETPIARLAQLARAVGIHLLIATQRPSVNVITGLIKANFPARIAFRVTSKVDSRTILDSGGADQLIGRGDMLYTQGNDLTRLQCGFIDTDEIEKITELIGAQKGYSDSYILPEYIEEDNNQSNTINIDERDSLFKDAAEVIVTAQQGSASLIQRKLKLGYNRAGRIIDQLESAGIVGRFEGSKARSVLVKNLVELEQLLKNE